jgi:hypothetical protein
LVSSLISATETGYHRKITDLILDTIDALMIEKRSGRAEDFKTRIIVKCSLLIPVVCQISED